MFCITSSSSATSSYITLQYRNPTGIALHSLHFDIRFHQSLQHHSLLIGGSFGAYTLPNPKRILTGTIRVYQRYAPESIQMKCRFEPSCPQ
ncbi:MAG: membrane protein insertion efficiency factor YidD [Lachnospiraceae bacterium]|nr:membrane protein insertion efficiency factor YidD [Lachnospiraceae bacterium]